MQTTDNKLHVFLCHASQDKPIVRELYQRLCSEGWIDPWLDEEKLLPGQDWDFEIEKNLETADAVIVCLSSRSVSKEGYVQKELRFVIDKSLEKPDDTIFMLPLRLDDCELPRRLRHLHYVDYFPEQQRRVNYQKLLESLNIRARKKNMTDRHSAAAPAIEFCSNCSTPFRRSDEIVRCKSCGVYYHKDCWNNLRRCRTANCGSLECFDVRMW